MKFVILLDYVNEFHAVSMDRLKEYYEVIEDCSGNEDNQIFSDLFQKLAKGVHKPLLLRLAGLNKRIYEQAMMLFDAVGIEYEIIVSPSVVIQELLEKDVDFAWVYNPNMSSSISYTVSEILRIAEYDGEAKNNMLVLDYSKNKINLGGFLNIFNSIRADHGFINGPSILDYVERRNASFGKSKVLPPCLFYMNAPDHQTLPLDYSVMLDLGFKIVVTPPPAIELLFRNKLQYQWCLGKTYDSIVEAAKKDKSTFKPCMLTVKHIKKLVSE